MPRFITYNLLSSDLSQPKTFPAADPRYLDPTFRFESICLRFKHILGGDAEDPTIFGLQEVALKWVGPLRAFFSTYDYSLIHTCYGNRFDGYMGVAIAWPSGWARFNDNSLVCPPQTYGRPGFERWKHEQAEIEAVWYRKLARLGKESMPFRPLLDKFQASPAPAPQTLIAGKFNRAVFGYVAMPNMGKVAIGTYHMPCLFKYPHVMAVHALLFFHALHEYCTRHDLDQFVVMMDGNFEPRSLPYNALQGLCTAEELATIDEISPGVTTLCSTNRMGESRTTFEFLTGMRHTYPQTSVTTFTHGHAGAFMGKIDYIWFKLASGYLTPDTKIAPTESPAEQTCLLPNREEPSDHYLLSALFHPNE